MNRSFLNHLQGQLDGIREAGLYKGERVITSPQRANITVKGETVLNLCANNYLGLGDSKDLIAAAKTGLDEAGFGMASVRFICGTQAIHKQLEDRLTKFLGTEDTILFSSCWDANGGVFEVVLGEEDAVISDALNHASIIDGVRLCKAKRFRYANNDMKELEQRLVEAKDSRFKLIVTDGVFSMDGVIADLKTLCDLADKHDAIVMVDDSHAVGFTGEKGRGSHELRGVLGRIDILTGTLGKALGGASGGYVSGRKEIVELLRQRARPYLFSNTLMPAIGYATLKALDLLESGDGLRKQLVENAAYFRAQMTKAGFTLAGEGHPIIPVMLGDAKLAGSFAEEMLKEGVYVVGFSFPVVPQGKARIRTQMSAAHTRADLDRAIAAFTKVGKKLGVIQ
ncbi:MAG: glycine C-acetyltransferase [Archangium gephyra]|uniref:2-amino-3-ketobutyrate coenzyme A ligase n=1 Tax=Archangium gephyra TaxID=48 RepID=A0A2W5VJ45_9BACT|nr:MAG: glycine C-acetyltransferase [Archangium gephyra]